MGKHLFDIVRHPTTRHISFWIGLFAVFSILGLRNSQNVTKTLLSEFVNMIGFAAVVYFNFHQLIPRFLSKKKTGLYLLNATLFVLLLTPIIALCLYLIQNGFSFEKKFGINQSHIFLLLLSVVVISTIFQIVSEWFRHERERRVLEQRRVQSELKFLKSQMNPHFLFNTLNSLYALTLKKSDEAPEIVLKLSDMMRYMLYECNEKRVLLEKEIAYIKNYLDLENLRQGKNVQIRLLVEGETGDKKIAPLLFIPFIENCFKHGVNHQIDEAFVDLKIVIGESQVQMDLSNSKPEQKPGHIKGNVGGIGQSNVRKQMDMIYGKNYNLDIEETPQLYRVNLKINLNPTL